MKPYEVQLPSEITREATLETVERLELWANMLSYYKQGTKALHPEADTYCCLGVACALFGNGEFVEIDLANPHRDEFKYGYRGPDALAYDDDFYEGLETQELPMELQELLALDGSGTISEMSRTLKGFARKKYPYLGFGDAVYSLAAANDDGKSFEEIAVCIREYANWLRLKIVGADALEKTEAMRGGGI